MQKPFKKCRYVLGYIYFDPEIEQFVIPPKICELNDPKYVFKGRVELNAERETIETLLTTQRGILFTS